MQLASHAPPLVLLRSKDLATCTAPLTPETNQFCYVMHADENVPRAMDRKRSNRDVEIVTIENSASLLQMSKDATRARADISKRL